MDDTVFDAKTGEPVEEMGKVIPFPRQPLLTKPVLVVDNIEVTEIRSTVQLSTFRDCADDI